MDFRDRLTMLRKQKGLALMDLADGSGYSRPTVRGYESGKFPPPVPKIIRDLGDALSLSPEERDCLTRAAFKNQMELLVIKYMPVEEILSL
jgi:transcriptional regulator with XRE-family HTH domain